LFADALAVDGESGLARLMTPANARRLPGEAVIRGDEQGFFAGRMANRSSCQ